MAPATRLPSGETATGPHGCGDSGSGCATPSRFVHSSVVIDRSEHLPQGFVPNIEGQSLFRTHGFRRSERNGLAPQHPAHAAHLLLTIETILVYFNFRDWIIAGFLAIGALWFVLDAAVLWKDRPYSPKEMRLFLWGWNIAALLGIFWNWSHGTLTRLHLVSGLQK